MPTEASWWVSAGGSGCRGSARPVNTCGAAGSWETDRGTSTSADLLLGDDGVLWIRDYPRPGEHGEWFSLSGDGERTRSLRLPPGARLEDIGPHWALVSWRDALDVERLAVYALVQN